MAIRHFLPKHILHVTAEMAVVRMELGIRISPISRALDMAGIRKGQEQETLRAEDAAELAKSSPIVRHMLQHMVTDDDVIAAVRPIDLLQVEAVRSAEYADLARAEPTAVDGLVRAELQAPQGAQSLGTKFEKDPAENAMALHRATALAPRPLAGRAQSPHWTVPELLAAADVAARFREALPKLLQQPHDTSPATSASSRFANELQPRIIRANGRRHPVALGKRAKTG